MRTNFLLKNRKTLSHVNVRTVPEWVIFLLKKQMLWTTHFSWKTDVFLMTSALQILQKFQVKPNQQHLFVTDISRAWENHSQYQSNISTGLPPLFPSYSNLKSRMQQFALKLCCQQVTEPLKPNGEKNPTDLQHDVFESPPSPPTSNHTLLQEERKPYGLLLVQQDLQ